MATGAPGMMQDWRARAMAIGDRFERKMFVMGLVEAALREQGEQPVVVGGTAVEWHTRGLYQSADIDLLCPTAPLADVLGAMGFEKEGRYWFDDELRIVIEAPGRSLDAYRNRTVEVASPAGPVTMLAAEESILDRVRAWVHWKSELDCEQALQMMVVQKDNIDWGYLERRAVRDQVVEKLAELRKRAEAVPE